MNVYVHMNIFMYIDICVQGCVCVCVYVFITQSTKEPRSKYPSSITKCPYSSPY